MAARRTAVGGNRRAADGVVRLEERVADPHRAPHPEPAVLVRRVADERDRIEAAETGGAAEHPPSAFLGRPRGQADRGRSADGRPTC
eukprot:SAG11_NODE_1636_length_4537_cov_2.667868_2_plen_87_part_00